MGGKVGQPGRSNLVLLQFPVLRRAVTSEIWYASTSCVVSHGLCVDLILRGN